MVSLNGEPDYGFRLVGQVIQGSIPWACVGSAVFLLTLLLILRLASMWLNAKTVNERQKEDKPMEKHEVVQVGGSLLETSWAVGVSYAGGTLPA